MKLKINQHRIWSLYHVRNFVESAQKSVGGVLGWDYLSDQMQSAVIANEVISIVFANHNQSLPVESIRCLFHDMKQVAGLNQTQED